MIHISAVFNSSALFLTHMSDNKLNIVIPPPFYLSELRDPAPKTDPVRGSV